MTAWNVARKEFMEHLRTKRLLIVGSIFLVAAMIGIWVGSLLARGLNFLVSDTHPSLAILAFYFGLFPLLSGINFTSILGILLSADAVVGEWKDRTLFLLLSKPLSRRQMLLGKFLGAVVAVFAVYAVVFAFAVGIVFVLAGVPSSSDLGRIFGAFVLIFVGMLPFVGIGLFTSSWFRTPTGSFIMAFALWFIILPLLGNVGRFIRFAQRDFGAVAGRSDPLVEAWQRVDPAFLMREGARFLFQGRPAPQILGGATDPRTGELMLTDVNVLLLVLVVAAHLFVWLGLALWLVERRDYA